MKRVLAILPAALLALPAAQAVPNDLACGLHANFTDCPGKTFFPPFAIPENRTRTVFFPGRPENPATN